MSYEEKKEYFARDRARIKQVLTDAIFPIDMAKIYSNFRDKFGYIPNIQRRVDELVQTGEVSKSKGRNVAFLRYGLTEAKTVVE